jgi:hypothetical protein
MSTTHARQWLRLLDLDPQRSQNIASSRSWPNLDFQLLAVHADDITPTSRECSAVLDNVENIYRYVRSYLRDFKERKENKMEETFERVTERHAERDED